MPVSDDSEEGIVMRRYINYSFGSENIIDSRARNVKRPLESIIEDIIGSKGNSQARVFLFVFIGSLLGSWNALQMKFVAPEVDFWCADEAESSLSSVQGNRTMECWVGDRACTKWNYDVGKSTSLFHQTIVSEWDLVCHQSWLPSLAQGVFMSGLFLGACTMSHFSDRYGRKWVILVGIVISCLGNVACLFVHSIIQFMIARFLVAFGLAANWSTGFVLLTELVGSADRGRLGIASQLGWALGYIMLPIVAWVYPDYLLILLVGAVIQTFQIIMYPFCIVESPRWLIVNGNLKQAASILRKVAIRNGMFEPVEFAQLIEEIKALQVAAASETPAVIKQYSVLDLFKTRAMASLTLVSCFIWMTTILIYYGLSLNTDVLSRNPFLNFFCLGIVEIPAYVLAFCLVKRVGSRRLLVIAMLGASSGCFSGVMFYNHTVNICFTMFGKMCVAGSFAIIYVYTATIYPTVTRTTGIGICCMVGHLGSLLAPFLRELHTRKEIPLLLFGGLGILATVGVLILPEAEKEDQSDEDAGEN